MLTRPAARNNYQTFLWKTREVYPRYAPVPFPRAPSPKNGSAVPLQPTKDASGLKLRISCTVARARRPLARRGHGRVPAKIRPAAEELEMGTRARDHGG